MTNRRVLASLIALVVAFAALVAPASAASAAGTTVGTIRVQLQTILGKDWAAKNFVVSATGKRDVYEKDTTNADGVAVLRVPPGKYTIKVETYETRYEYAVVTKKLIAIQRGQSKTIGMPMRKGGQITGKVTSPTGFALKKAMVAAVNRKGVVLASTTTDKKGKYRLAGLPTGKYAVIFNYRSYADGTNKAANRFGWKYYGGTNLANAKYTKVYAQNKFADATKTTGVSGTAANAADLGVVLSQRVSKTSRLLVDRISEKGTYLQSDSVYAPFAGGTQRTLKLNPGKYRLGINVGGTNYYYTGDGQPLTTLPQAAVYTYFGTTPLTVAFGPIP